MNTTLPRMILIVGLAISTIACGRNDGPGEPATTAPPTATDASAVRQTEPPPPPVGIACPNSHGGTCLGTIPAGTYTTTTFRPPINYTIPERWINGEDLPGNFLLQLEADARYLAIFRDVAAPFECEEYPDPSVGRSVTAYSDWLTAHPGLVTTEPQPVSIGGLNGVFMDITLEPSWAETCPFSEGKPVVPFIIGGGVSSLEHVILPGFHERLYLLEKDGGNVAIEIGPEGASLEEYLQKVEPIISSLHFG